MGVRGRRRGGVRRLPVHAPSQFAAALTTLVDALGYGPTFVRGWSQPNKDSATSFALNGVKFVPSLMAMDPISFATSFYPATLLVLNTAVAIMLVIRRRAPA